MKPPDDEQLDALLRALPRTTVPERFAGQVLSGIERRRRLRARWRNMAAALAVAALGSSLWLASPPGAHAPATTTAVLRDELHRLSVELEQLEQQRARMRPVLHLAATDEVDIVIDLHRLAQRRLTAYRQHNIDTPEQSAFARSSATAASFGTTPGPRTPGDIRP